MVWNGETKTVKTVSGFFGVWVTRLKPGVNESALRCCRRFQTTLDGVMKVTNQLLNGLSLSGTARNRGNLSPKATFFRVVNYHLNFHGLRYSIQDMPSSRADYRGKLNQLHGAKIGPILIA